MKRTFLKLINNAIVGKTMESVRKHRNIKFVLTGTRRNYLASEPSYHTTWYYHTKLFTEYLSEIKMKKQNYL